MKQLLKNELAKSIESFKLPKYNEIPDVGLFLEQTTKYISGILAPLEGITITSSMISNYVKKKLVSSPVKKQYNREQIAYLIFIAVAKTVLSLENIQRLIDLQKQSYESRAAYEYFCSEFENMLFYVFGKDDFSETVSSESTEEKVMLRNTIITAVHKVYLETCFAIINKNDENPNL